MRSSRRKFLKCLGAGAVGATGALLPTAAEGGLFCRRRHAPPCPQPLQQAFVPQVAAQMGPVYIEYPPPFGGQVGVTPVGGDFYAWGYLASNTITGFDIALYSDAACTMQLTYTRTPVTQTPTQGNGWAYRFNGIAPNTTFYIKMICNQLPQGYITGECTATAF